MVTDFQAAWTELMARVAAGGADGKKTSWGQNELLQEMGKIAGETRVREDLLEAASRLTGFPFNMQTAGTDPSLALDSVSDDEMDADRRPPNDLGGHDGRESTGAATRSRGSRNRDGRTGDASRVVA